jgi:hypothetical protein
MYVCISIPLALFGSVMVLAAMASADLTVWSIHDARDKFPFDPDMAEFISNHTGSRVTHAMWDDVVGARQTGHNVLTGGIMALSLTFACFTLMFVTQMVFFGIYLCINRGSLEMVNHDVWAERDMSALQQAHDEFCRGAAELNEPSLQPLPAERNLCFGDRSLVYDIQQTSPSQVDEPRFQRQIQWHTHVAHPWFGFIHLVLALGSLASFTIMCILILQEGMATGRPHRDNIRLDMPSDTEAALFYAIPDDDPSPLADGMIIFAHVLMGLALLLACVVTCGPCCLKCCKNK